MELCFFPVFALTFMFPTCSIKYVKRTVSLQVIGVHDGSTFCIDVVAAHVAFIAGLQNTLRSLGSAVLYHFDSFCHDSLRAFRLSRHLK